MYNTKTPYKELKKYISFCGHCYITSKTRLLMNDYDSRFFVEEIQVKNDLEFVTNMNMHLSHCQKESTDLLMTYYFDNTLDKMYYESLPRSTFYRMHKKAIYEIADCLHL